LNTSSEHSISNDIVRGIFQDSKGSLWIATEGDLNKYDLSSEEFSVFEEPLFVNNTIRVMAEKSGWLYALKGAGGLIRFQDEKPGFERSHFDDGFKF
jgi:ligand-binding sensor domain-containing protein